jgi:hypothetical protein
MTKFRYPTAEELHAFELAARRARAEELARLVRAAAAGVKSGYGYMVSTLTAKLRRHA